MAPQSTQNGISCSEADGARKERQKGDRARRYPADVAGPAQKLDEIDDEDHAANGQKHRQDQDQEAGGEIAAEGPADHRGSRPGGAGRAPERAEAAAGAVRGAHPSRRFHARHFETQASHAPQSIWYNETAVAATNTRRTLTVALRNRRRRGLPITEGTSPPTAKRGFALLLWRRDD